MAEKACAHITSESAGTKNNASKLAETYVRQFLMSLLYSLFGRYYCDKGHRETPIFMALEWWLGQQPVPSPLVKIAGCLIASENLCHLLAGNPHPERLCSCVFDLSATRGNLELSEETTGCPGAARFAISALLQSHNPGRYKFVST